MKRSDVHSLIWLHSVPQRQAPTASLEGPAQPRRLQPLQTWGKQRSDGTFPNFLMYFFVNLEFRDWSYGNILWLEQFFCLVHNKILLLIVQTLPWSPSPNDLFGMGVRNAEAEYVMLIMNVDWNCWFPATRAAKAGSHSKLWFNYSSYPQRRYWSISVDETHIWFVNHLFWWNPHRPRVHLLPNSNTRISSSVRVVKSPFHHSMQFPFLFRLIAILMQDCPNILDVQLWVGANSNW